MFRRRFRRDIRPAGAGLDPDGVDGDVFRFDIVHAATILLARPNVCFNSRSGAE